MESIVVGRDAGDVVEDCVERTCRCEMGCPAVAGFDAVEEIGSCWTAILRFERVDTTWLEAISFWFILELVVNT